MARNRACNEIKKYFCIMDTTENINTQAEDMARELRSLVARLEQAGRYDLMLRAISVPVVERLRIEAARAKLSRLVITRDMRFILKDYPRR